MALIEDARRAEGRRMAYSLLGHSSGAQFPEVMIA